ncbi:MAG: lysophospholipid acyltransferase family protein [Deltaproteobacteria bacterium]
MLSQLRGWLTTAYAALFMVLIFFGSLPVMFVTRSGELPMRLARRIWAPWGMWLAGVDFQVVEKAPLPEGPAVFAANHSSAIDIWAAIAAIPRSVRFIAKAELFRWPIFGWYMRVGGHIPVDRRDHQRAVASLAKAAARVRAGTSLIAFPEGTRSRDNLVHAFKKGPFVIAIQAGVPVVPMAITGAGKVTPKSLLRVHPGPVRVTFGTPVHPSDFPGRDALLREVRRQIIAMDREAGGPGGADEPALAFRGLEGDVGDSPPGR